MNQHMPWTQYFIGMLCCALSACHTPSVPSPFPPLQAVSQQAKAQMLQTRTTGLHTLTAVVTLTLTSPARQGTFDMIVQYDAGGKMRFTALKETLLSSQTIFDLLLDGTVYYLTISATEEVQQHQGPLTHFMRDHPEFRAFPVLREAFFLPGFDARGRLPTFTPPTASQFTTQLTGGATAHWFIEKTTLEITHARIDWETPGETPHRVSFHLRYGDYRQMLPYYIPGRLTLIDRQQGVTVVGFVRQIEINIPHPPEAFQPPPHPGHEGT